MQAMSYQKSWSIIDKSVWNIVHSFFNHGHMSEELNRTYITLPNRIGENVGHCRPSSLCDVSYKMTQNLGK